MRIRNKLNFITLGTIAAILIGIGVFIPIYRPVLHMQAEKNSLFELDSAILRLRAEVDKLPLANYDLQLEEVLQANEDFLSELEHISELKYLHKDPKIAESLEIITHLFDLYETNYKDFLTNADEVSKLASDIFLSATVKLFDVQRSTLLQRHKNNVFFVYKVDGLISKIAILENNLISTHGVVIKQFEIIDSLIAHKALIAYIFGLSIILFIGIVSAIVALLSSAHITRNVTLAGEGIRMMSGGDISTDFNIKSNDEIGQLGSDLNTLNENLRSALFSMKEESKKGVGVKDELIASSNQTSAAASEIAANSEAISKQFTKLHERVDAAANANNDLKHNLNGLEDFIKEQTSMIEESTSAVTEMISSIKSVSDITQKKKETTTNLVTTAASGGEKLGNTISVIAEINQSLDQIKGTASIIQQIASQTNLLAMNAAIEAAHAGDAGMGFAVVADEIRKLAEASSRNSKSISGILKDVVDKIETASSSGYETEKAFSEIDTEVHDVAMSFDEISSSMVELNEGGKRILEVMANLQTFSEKVEEGSQSMTTSSLEVSDAISIVSRVTTEVSNSATEITTGINEVSSAMIGVTDLCGVLGDITERLDSEAAQFKTESDLIPSEESEEIESEASEDYDRDIEDLEEISTAETSSEEDLLEAEYNMV
ncbi:MAG: methyl-accepting chemotaxis protein [Spirochaetales bacterium]|nr:methyl-accepting chemotaxis protein [Spirochaetales bacterium]